jgi:hypothetical protein
MTAKLHYFALLLFFTGGFFSYYDKKNKRGGLKWLAKSKN